MLVDSGVPVESEGNAKHAVGYVLEPSKRPSGKAHQFDEGIQSARINTLLIVNRNMVADCTS